MSKHEQLAKAKGLTPEHIAAKTGMTAQGIKSCLANNRIPSNHLIAATYRQLLGLPKENA